MDRVIAKTLQREKMQEYKVKWNHNKSFKKIIGENIREHYS